MNLLKILGIILLLIVGILLIVERVDEGKSDVHKWATEHNMQVKN
jgi:hypothetical protein